MHVYLIRHGQAVSSDVDPQRGLSEEGRHEAERLAEFLARNSVETQEIWHSSKERARQTAEILRDRGHLGGRLIEQSGLLPEDPVDPIVEELVQQSGDVCIVGHLPFMAYLASALTSGGSGAPQFMFDTCGMLCLEREGPGVWGVRWFIAPHMLPHVLL